MNCQEANVAQEDMLIASATEDDLRALCKLQQELIATKDLRIRVLETQLGLANFQAQLNKETLEQMYAGN